ncbi:hypothetical protein NPIL_393521 [Nephila pilipes]|uniref:Uncharacterized protein n=1 Tax=Nephila pilipes TaxID=299642 RepID=A0A8X6N2A1_NEPPI|nr:hypothetical protein NPIL_393521 [Nephila pilipes]
MTEKKLPSGIFTRKILSALPSPRHPASQSSSLHPRTTQQSKGIHPGCSFQLTAVTRHCTLSKVNTINSGLIRSKSMLRNERWSFSMNPCEMSLTRGILDITRLTLRA